MMLVVGALCDPLRGNLSSTIVPQSSTVILTYLAVRVLVRQLPRAIREAQLKFPSICWRDLGSEVTLGLLWQKNVGWRPGAFAQVNQLARRISLFALANTRSRQPVVPTSATRNVGHVCETSERRSTLVAWLQQMWCNAHKPGAANVGYVACQLNGLSRAAASRNVWAITGERL